MRNLRQSWMALVLMLMGMTPRPSAAPDTAAVEVRLFQFQPAALEVPAGSRVSWANADDIEHTVTTGEPDHPDGQFAGTLAGKGSRLSFRFDRPGVYSYFCDRHHFMRGEIRVTQPGKAGT